MKKSDNLDAGYFCAMLSGAVLYGTRDERINYVTKYASEKLGIKEYIRYTEFLTRVRSALSMADSLEVSQDG